VLGARPLAPGDNVLLGVSLTFALGVLGPGFLLLYAQRVLDPGWLRRAWRLPAIMIIGCGVAWSTSLAVLGALRGKDLDFVRTPKFGIGPAGGHWRGKGYADRGRGSAVVELALAVYCAWSAWLFALHAQYAAVPFLVLYTMGFLTVGTLTLVHAAPGRRQGRATGGP
jgi:hypothetical protein